jgi:uncharacterized membrane protein
MRLIRNSALRHMLYELNGGYLVWPFVIMAFLSLIACILPPLESENRALSLWSHHTKWLVPSDPSMAQLLLGAIAGSCITVVCVVYSVLLIALTFASIQFSPRILSTFLKDRVCQATLGVYIGTFAYCLILLPGIHSGATVVVPTLSLTLALALATTCMLFLIYFIHHIALAIQANYIVARIGAETVSVLDRCFGASLKGFPSSEQPIQEPNEGKAVASLRSGYMQFIDETRLLRLAKSNDLVIYIHRSVGQYIPAGAPCVTISPFPQASREIVGACLECFHIGPVRSMEDDVECGVLQIVDIALKAISPAVNDPSTCIACIDQLSSILLRAAGLEPPASRILDETGTLRITRRQTSFIRLLEIAFDQISPYGKGDMAVSLRLMRALQDISGATNYPPYLAAILKHAKRIVRAVSSNFEPTECEEIWERLARIESKQTRSIE